MRSFDQLPRALGLMALAAGMASAAQAQEFNAVDRISLSVGAYQVSPTVSARGASDDGAANVSSFSGRKANLPRVTLDLRLFERQGLSFDYYRYDRSDRFTGFDADGTLSSRLEFGKASYRWWFGSGDAAFSVGAGASYYRASSRSRGEFPSQGGGRTSLDVQSSGGKLAPFGEVGLRYAFGPDVRLFADASGAWRNTGGRRASIYNGAVGVEWFPVRNVGLSASYSVSDFKLKYRDEVDSFLNLRLTGPSVMMKLRF